MSQPPPPASRSQSATAPRLRHNSLGIWYLGGMAMAWMGLAIATYFVIPFMEQAAGPITPLIFLFLIVAMMPTAISYALMNKRRPSAGGPYTWPESS